MVLTVLPFNVHRAVVQPRGMHRSDQEESKERFRHPDSHRVLEAEAAAGVGLMAEASGERGQHRAAGRGALSVMSTAPLC
jgi:hypothetical protein